jgi:hypothetical protein
MNTQQDVRMSLKSHFSGTIERRNQAVLQPELSPLQRYALAGPGAANDPELTESEPMKGCVLKLARNHLGQICGMIEDEFDNRRVGLTAGFIGAKQQDGTTVYEADLIVKDISVTNDPKKGRSGEKRIPYGIMITQQDIDKYEFCAHIPGLTHDLTGMVHEIGLLVDVPLAVLKSLTQPVLARSPLEVYATELASA